MPATASAKFSCRLVPDQDPDAIASGLRQHLEQNAPKGVRWTLSASQGAPGMVADTNSPFMQAAKNAIDAGATRYTAARGTVELREAICEVSAKRRAGVTYDPSQVVVSVGAKHTLFNLALALYDEGDEVLIPAPYWVSYPEQVRLAGATPVIVQTSEDEGFRMTPEALRAAITPKTKLIYAESPTNPGVDILDLGALGTIAKKHGLILVIDNCFASPYLQQPLKFGADLVIHSGTKLMDGHQNADRDDERQYRLQNDH